MPERDLPLVSTWLALPHVTRWWGDPAASERAVREHRIEDSALLCVDDDPVGYVCWQVLDEGELERVGLSDLPKTLVDIDIFIAQPSAIGRGIGSEALAQLCRHLHRKGVALAGIAASPQNQAACRAYKKVGFQPFRAFYEAGQVWHYMTKALSAAA